MGPAFSGHGGVEAVAVDRAKGAGVMTEPVPLTLSSPEMRDFFRSIYRDAGMLTRELNVWRHLICPYEPVLRWVPPGARVLDFGCGAGAVLMLLSERRRIASGIGCDVSEQAIAAAK